MKALVSLFAAIATGMLAQPALAEKLDSGLYTLYHVSDDTKSVSYLICGSVPGSSGCYGSGNLASLDRACAVMEGKPTYMGDVVTRDIYVFDKRSSSSHPALVNVYVRTDTIADGGDSITLKLKKHIKPGIGGAPNANCYMAGNDALIIVGTDASQTAARIGLGDSKVSQIKGETNVQSITADQRGYITVSYISNQFYTIGPNGHGGGDGGGTYEMANTRNAFTTNPSSPRH